MSFYWIWILVPLYGVLGWISTTWIRARHGYPLADGRGRPVHQSAPLRDKIKELKAAVKSRDGVVAELEHRVRVLERIATDRSEQLRVDIERL